MVHAKIKEKYRKRKEIMRTGFKTHCLQLIKCTISKPGSKMLIVLFKLP